MVLGDSAGMFKPQTCLIPAVLSASSETVPHGALEVMGGLAQITSGFFPLAWYNVLCGL